jgi:hypothetical protein
LVKIAEINYQNPDRRKDISEKLSVIMKQDDNSEAKEELLAQSRQVSTDLLLSTTRVIVTRLVKFSLFGQFFENFKRGPNCRATFIQGDQIRRIFAQMAIVCYWQFVQIKGVE